MGHPCTWGLGQIWRIQNRCLWKCLADYSTSTSLLFLAAKKEKKHIPKVTASSVQQLIEKSCFVCCRSRLSQTTMHVDAVLSFSHLRLQGLFSILSILFISPAA